MILAVFLYVIAAWFSIATLALGIAAANRPGWHQRTFLMVLSAASLGVAVVQVLAAGGRS